MKKWLLIIAFCTPTALFAGMLIMGDGKGNLTKTDMQGLRPGDTIAIRPGTYAYSQFKHLRHITIINYKGRVIFSGEVVEFEDNDDVQFSGSGVAGMEYGFYFHDIPGNSIATFGHHRACSWSHIEFKNCMGPNGVINPQDARLHYDGVHDETKEYIRCQFTHMHLDHCTGFIANYSGPMDNVQDSCEYAYIVIDSAETVTQINSGSLYGADIHHWVINDLVISPRNDVGCFQIAGSVKIHHCLRKGFQWGWFLRLNQQALAHDQDSYVYNNIDLGSIAYGFVDYRVSVDNSSSPVIAGGNLYVCNNTVGNYKNQNNYATPILIIYGSNHYQAFVRNNLRFNSRNSSNTVPSDTIGVIDFSGAQNFERSNNLYSSDPIADGVLRDTVQCYLVPDGPAVDAGLALSFVTNDFGDVTRPQGRAYDIGARENTEPVDHATRRNATGLGTGLRVLFPLAFLLVGAFFIFRWGVRGPRRQNVHSQEN